MSDTLASLQRQINSAGDLQSVVRTMKALAAANIGQFEASILALADYYRTVELGFAAHLRDVDSAPSFADNRLSVDGVVCAIVFGSDQGLVGQFNELIANHAISALARMPGKVVVWAIGERIHERLTDAGLLVRETFNVPSSIRAVSALVSQIQMAIESLPMRDAPPQVYVYHNKPQVGSLYEPVSQRLLPLDEHWQRDVAKTPWPTTKIPQVIGNRDDALRSLVHEYLFISLYRACAESLAAENASRLAAMQRAEKNIDDVLSDLRGAFHCLRQSNIDEELFDVISGFEALGGANRHG